MLIAATDPSTSRVVFYTGLLAMMSGVAVLAITIGRRSSLTNPRYVSSITASLTTIVLGALVGPGERWPTPVRYELLVAGMACVVVSLWSTIRARRLRS